MRYTAEIKTVLVDGQTDHLVLLGSTSGEQVWISERAASIEELALQGPYKGIRRLVFGHYDAVAGRKLEQPF